jgi:hypothetical protein
LKGDTTDAAIARIHKGMEGMNKFEGKRLE